MENIRNKVDVRLVNNEKQARKLVNKINFEKLKIFDKNLIAIHMKKKTGFQRTCLLGNVHS